MIINLSDSDKICCNVSGKVLTIKMHQIIRCCVYEIFNLSGKSIEKGNIDNEIQLYIKEVGKYFVVIQNSFLYSVKIFEIE